MTSTSLMASSSTRAVITSLTASFPCTATSRTSNSIPGQRSRALTKTSCIASLARPQINPILRGRKGNCFLRSGANRPSEARSSFSLASWARSSPSPTARTSVARIVKEPLRVQKFGCALITTRCPGSSGCVRARNFPAGIITLRDISAARSRNVKY